MTAASSTSIALRLSDDLAQTGAAVPTGTEIAEAQSALVVGDSNTISALSDTIYGEVGQYTSSALSQARAADHPEVLALIKEAQNKAARFSPSRMLGPVRLGRKMVRGMLGLATGVYGEIKDQMSTVDAEMGEIERKLTQFRPALEATAEDMKVLHGVNERQHHRTLVAIAAAQVTLRECEETLLPEMRANMAEASEDARQMLDQQIGRAQRWCDELRLVIGEWEAVRTNCVLASRQIDLLSSGSLLMAKTIQRMTASMIPEWRKAFAIALGVEQMQSATMAADASRAVTNRITVRSAKMLAQQLPKAITSAMRPMYDLQTLQTATQHLNEGMARAEAEYGKALQQVERSRPEYRRIEESIMRDKRPATPLALPR